MLEASENEALVRRLLEEAYNQGNLTVGDELLAANCIFYTPAPIQGIAGWKQYATAFLTAFPDDLQVTIDDIFSAGDRVVARWTAQGTHRGLHAVRRQDRRGVGAQRRARYHAADRRHTLRVRS